MPILKPTAGADFTREHIKPGTYQATITKIEQIQMPDPNKPGQMADRLRWSFEIVGKTRTVTLEGVTSLAWGPGVPGKTIPKAWRWVGAILQETPPEEMDTDELIGVPCSVKVADRERDGKAYSVVEDIPPPAEEL